LTIPTKLVEIIVFSHSGEILVPSLKSILPFWRNPVSSRETAPVPCATQSDDFGKASGFELQFDRLMDDPQARRNTLFPTGNCR
jgi:hypothetical protein